MKKVKAIVLTIWFELAVGSTFIVPFIFNNIDVVLLILNVVIPFVLLISDKEVRDMDIF